MKFISAVPSLGMYFHVHLVANFSQHVNSTDCVKWSYYLLSLSRP